MTLLLINAEMLSDIFFEIFEVALIEIFLSQMLKVLILKLDMSKQGRAVGFEKEGARLGWWPTKKTHNQTRPPKKIKISSVLGHFKMKISKFSKKKLKIKKKSFFPSPLKFKKGGPGP